MHMRRPLAAMSLLSAAGFLLPVVPVILVSAAGFLLPVPSFLMLAGHGQGSAALGVPRVGDRPLLHTQKLLAVIGLRHYAPPTFSMNNEQ